MADPSTNDSPLDTAIGATGPHVTGIFKLLATRRGWQSCWHSGRRATRSPGGCGTRLPRTPCRSRTCATGSASGRGAQFNYHLDKLVGQFVRKTEEGYELLPAGNEIVRTVIGIAGSDEPPFERAEIDLPCPLCGAVTALTYRNQRLYRVCTACDGYYTTESDDIRPACSWGRWRIQPA